MYAYLDDGTFDLLGMNYILEKGIELSAGHFQPEAYINFVKEPDFGCEGRPEGKPIFAELEVYTIKGPKTLLAALQTLDETGLYDQMWVGYLKKKDGSLEFVSCRDGVDEYTVVDKVKWDNLMVKNK
ncbi:hypothetical protein [Lachnobacterium bovis]|uniref:Uncharacterized protein n=1 Tax=Lachnobacterium bovis TaxID=140626 RepID=A0A1H9TJM8_9FIRM|nr:hypothetical protein [Lachnobacterium bovis]SER96803.1 hypothetical protein SAMN02910429_01644 [Lachnobacterium bovis]